MHIEVETIICTKRFKYLGHWKGFSDYLFSKNLDSEILGHPLLAIPCDGMLVRYVLGQTLSNFGSL